MFTLFNVVVGALMIGSFIGMIICAKKQHSSTIAQPLAVVFLLVVVVCTALILKRTLGREEHKILVANAQKFTRASSYVLGKKLAEIKPGARVLLIVDKQDETNKHQKAIIDGLREGFGSAITNIVIKSPEIKPPKRAKGAPQVIESVSVVDAMTAKDFNKLIDKNKSCNLIITTIGLPRDIANLTIWEKFEDNPKKAPKLAILIGDISQLGVYIKTGLIPASVVYKPDAPIYEDAVPEDMQKTFDLRYLLVTTQNIDDVFKKYGDKIFHKLK